MQGDSVRARKDGDVPLMRDSLQQQIYQRLCDGLVSGAYVPGQVISSRGLAERLGVSAMPVREALTRLTAEGALEPMSSRTLRVRLLTPGDFEELTAIRVEMEGMAAERAAASLTRDDLARVRVLHAELVRATAGAETDRYLAANAAFHDGIYLAAGWPMLLGMVRRLWLMVGPSIRSSVPDRKHMATSMTFHDAALAALAEGNAPAVRAAIVGDIRTAATGIRARLEARDREATALPLPPT